MRAVSKVRRCLETTNQTDMACAISYPSTMSKKKPNKPQHLPVSQELISVGPKHVQTKYLGKRDESGLKPSTSRALVLRNGKYGARGTGEVILAGRISGREKLDLLAGTSISSFPTQFLTPSLEDLVAQRSRTALMAPFNLDKCIKIANSQYNGMFEHTYLPCFLPLTLAQLTSTTLPISRTLTCSAIGSWLS